MPRAVALREDALRRDPPEEPLREGLLDEPPRVEALLLLRDLPDWLALVRVLLELPADEIFDRPLPDLWLEAEERVLREDDLVPDDLDELLRALDLCAI